MKITVIHHSADFDGLFCREVARKFLPDAELIGWDFGDAPLEIPEGSIYILDLPVDRVFGFNYANKASVPLDFVAHGDCRLERIIWIDHHKSSIESHPSNIPGYRIDGVAACRLAWQWFDATINGQKDPHGRHNDPITKFPWATKQDFVDRKVSEPLAVRLAGEYDIWDKRDKDADVFQHGLRSEVINYKALLAQSEDIQIAQVSHLLKQGKGIQFARDNEYRDVITQQGFTVNFEGVNFLACNSHELDIRSQLFEAGVKPEHEALLGFTFNGKDWRVSMYRIPGKETDILSIAKKYNGGGHPGACGCRMEKLPFI